jgi:SAM-dependent methyltransferase
MLRAFANRGLEVHGTEISAAAAQGADPRAIVHIGERLEEVGFPDAYFDEVVLWHVFEHLRDPRETVREVHRILRPGGRLVLAVPNLASWQARITGAGWFHLDPPRHLYHYPLTALRQLVEQADFTCSAVHHFSLRQNPFGWLQSVLNRFTSLPRNGLYVMLHRADHGPKPFTRPIRWMFRAAFYAGMPVAVVLSVCEALCGHGGTVTLVATRASGSHATQDGRHTLSTPPAAH